MTVIVSDNLPGEVADIRQRAQELVNGLAPEQLVRRPGPAQWSIAECLAHLNVTAAVVQPFIAKAIARGKKDKVLGERPFKLGARGRLLIWMAQPPPRFRMRAPKAVAPPPAIPEPAQVLPEFMRAQDEWERLWEEADGLDLGRVNIGPLLSPFRCHLSASFPWMIAHQRRHLLQAEKVKRQILSAAAIGAAKEA